MDPFDNESLCDWTIPENRRAFVEALKEVKQNFPYKVPLLIGGEDRMAGSSISSTNPNDPDQLIGVAAAAGKEEKSA